jgi:hypothetical protein
MQLFSEEGRSLVRGLGRITFVVLAFGVPTYLVQVLGLKDAYGDSAVTVAFIMSVLIVGRRWVAVFWKAYVDEQARRAKQEARDVRLHL